MSRLSNERLGRIGEDVQANAKAAREDSDWARRRVGRARASSVGRAIAVLWGGGCALALVYEIAFTGLDERREHMLNVYYQAPAVATLACLLWASNVRTWQRLRLSPSPLVCFGVENTETELSEQFYRVAYMSALALLTSMVFFLRTYDVDEPFAATTILLATYLLPLVIWMWPNHNTFGGHMRAYGRRLIFHCVTPFSRPVGFADFFFADVLCSLAKSLSDLERVGCSVRYGIMLIHTSNGRCGDRSWRIPAVLVIPSIIRLFQCLRQFRDTREKKCLYNAFKYTSAFPVIVISGVRHAIEHDDWIDFWRPIWIAFCVFNTSFSFYWDVKHDWKLSLLGSDAPRRVGEKSPFGLREQRIYGGVGVYYRAILLNLFLRISWTYKLAPHLRHNSGFLWLVTAAEITRRFQWSLFRVEVEYLRRLAQDN